MRWLGCMALALLASPAFAQATDPDRVVRPYWWDKPVVEALGRALTEVQPNRASFMVQFIETDGNASKAMESAVASAKAAQEAIRKVAGDGARIQTSVNVAPYFEQYRDKEGELVDNERADKVKGYEARATLDITLTNTALAGRARAAALALGPQQSDEIDFYLEETLEMQLAAYKTALENARARADISAAATGNKLGATLVIQEGNGPCLGNWSTTQMARQTTPRPATRETVQVTSNEFAVAVTAMKRDRRIEITEADIARLDLASDHDPVTVRSAVCVVYELLK